jgi:hypothetical protein
MSNPLDWGDPTLADWRAEWEAYVAAHTPVMQQALRETARAWEAELYAQAQKIIEALHE